MEMFNKMFKFLNYLIKVQVFIQSKVVEIGYKKLSLK